MSIHLKILFCSCVMQAAAGWTTARADLIASWHFDEGSGTTAFDSFGSVDGTLLGDASFITDGISNGAASMTAAGVGLINMGDNFNLTGNATFSIVAWYRIANGDTNPHIIAGRHRAGSANGYLLSANDITSSSGEVDGGAMFYQAYPNPVSVDLGLNDGNWHQLVGVHDLVGNQARLYVDGVLRGTTAFDGLIESDGNFAVGGVLNPAGTQLIGSMTGDVDEVSLWDHALSQSEITQLYNNPGSATAVPEPTGLVLLSSLTIAGAALRRHKRGISASPTRPS